MTLPTQGEVAVNPPSAANRVIPALASRLDPLAPETQAETQESASAAQTLDAHLPQFDDTMRAILELLAPNPSPPPRGGVGMKQPPSETPSQHVIH